MLKSNLQEKVHPKMKIIYFTHAHDFLNLSDFHSSAEHKDILIKVSKPNSFGYHSFSLDEQKKH